MLETVHLPVLEVQTVKLYRVIKVDELRKKTNGTASTGPSNIIEVRHTVKVVKPWKLVKKFWRSWL